MVEPINDTMSPVPEGPVVLIADDDNFFRKPLVDALTFFGHKVIEACNGKELYLLAERLLKRGGKFAIIVDNQMPENTEREQRQWCGFERILKLCNDYPHYNLKRHVLFLSRWEIQDLPDDLLEKGNIYGLLLKDHWLSLYTSFTILKVYIERILELEG